MFDGADAAMAPRLGTVAAGAVVIEVTGICGEEKGCMVVSIASLYHIRRTDLWPNH